MSFAALPDPLFLRPVTIRDAQVVTDLFRAAEVHDVNEAFTTLEDLLGDWNSPDLDLAEETLAAFDPAGLVAYAHCHQWKAYATVHPRARSRGIGTALLKWTEDTTLHRRSPHEEARIGQTVSDRHRTAVELFEGNGYTPRHSSWALRLPKNVEIQSRTPLAGYIVRPFDPSTETRQVYEIIEDAFNEWPNRTPTSFEAWKAMTVDRDDFDPELLFVAAKEGRVVGAALCLPYPDEGWVHQLAVQRQHRNQGLAKLLLATAFGEMRSVGFPEVGLSTDSRTGALDLYLNIGMKVYESFTHFSKQLRPASGQML